MSNVTQKRKQTAVSIRTKLEILEKIDRKFSVKDIMEEYGLGRRTVYDIIASKETIMNYTLSVEPGVFTDQSSIFEKARMKKPKFGDLDKAVYDWYKQQRSTGLLVKGSCIQAAAERFAKFLNVENFNASSGWLQRFRDRHGISNRRIVQESKCAAVASVAPFVELQQLPTLLYRNSHISSATSDPVKLEDINVDVIPITEVPVTLTSDGVSVPSPSTTSFTKKEPELYHLQYSDHVTTILAALAKDEEFMDVTLIAQGQSIKAHKSVLSAMSSYFYDVLRDNPCQHPVIIMPHDVLFEDLVSIISYIYKGEVTVAADKMMSVLKIAKILQISGMASSDFVPVNGFHMGSSVASTSDFSASSPSTGTSAMHNIHSTIMPNSKPIKNLKRCKRKNTSSVLLGKNSLAVVNYENSSVATSANQQHVSLIATPQKFSTKTKHQNSSVVACPSDNSLILASHTCDTSVTDTQLKAPNNSLSSSSLSWDSHFTRISNPEPIVQEETNSIANSKPSDSMNCIDDGFIKEEIIEVDEEEF